MYDNVTIPCPEGYKWVCAARKKDIEWQTMRDWRILGARKHFQSLEKLSYMGFTREIVDNLSAELSKLMDMEEK